MSDIGKLQRPEASTMDPAELREQDAPGAVLDEPAVARERAGGELKYRASGGAGGVAPMQRLMDERRSIGGQLAARVQRKADGGGAAQVEIPEGGGSKLPAGVRSKMEPKLGADLSDVRVHTGGASAQAASGLGARAFTVGSDVHFNAGEFAPGSKDGDRLLAHELTHVVQGKKSGIQRKADEGANNNAAAGHDNANANNNANGNEVSHPDEPAEKEADAVADNVTDSLHGGDKKGKAKSKGKDKKQGPAGAGAHDADGNPDENANEEGAHGHAGGAEHANNSAGNANANNNNASANNNANSNAPVEKPAAISAKFIGVGRKIFRAKGTPPAATGPAKPGAAGAKPAAGTSPPAAAAPEPPLTAATAKAALDGAAPDCTDLTAELAKDWVGKQKADLDKETADRAKLKRSVLDKFLAAGTPKAQTQTVGSRDPIAIQKFQDVDQEAHLSVPSLKDTFYQNLLAEMKKPEYTDRTRTYPAMKASAPPPTFAFKGNPIPAERISPLSSRNHSVDRLFDINIIAADLEAAIEKPLADAGAPPDKISDAKKDPERRKKAYRHLLKSGRDPMTTIDKSKPISQWGTWYAPGEIKPNPSAAANTEFANMMTLGALQPEWYPNGTVVLNIDRRLSGAARNIKKPTAFDGMMSALWTARNMGVDDYGVTGGGLGEFLEANVPFSDVSSSHAIIPDDDFLADIQRVVTEVKNKTGGASTPTEEALRGQKKNEKILNTTGDNTGGAKDMYGQVVDRSTQEQNHPSAAPQAPGAAQPNSAALPGGAAAAPKGAYDQVNGPRKK